MSVSSVTAGSIFSRALTVTFSNSGIFILINAILSLPILIWTFYIGQSIETVYDLADIGTDMIYLAPVSILLSFISLAAITYGVFRSLRGESTSLALCIQKGISKFVPVLGVVFVFALVAIGVAVVFGIFFAASQALAGLLGIALLVVAFPVIMSVSVTIPAVVTENIGPVEGIKRSRELTDGYKLSIFGALFIFGLINGAINKVLEVTIVGSITPENIQQVVENFSTYLLVTSIVGIVLSTFSTVITAVAYHDLRIVREGLDEDRLAALFD
jgi:hypothetical protein